MVILKNRVAAVAASIFGGTSSGFPNVVICEAGIYSNMSFTWTKILLVGSVVSLALLPWSINSLSPSAPVMRTLSVVIYVISLLPLVPRGFVFNAGERYWASLRIITLASFHNQRRALL